MSQIDQSTYPCSASELVPSQDGRQDFAEIESDCSPNCALAMRLLIARCHTAGVWCWVKQGDIATTTCVYTAQEVLEGLNELVMQGAVEQDGRRYLLLPIAITSYFPSAIETA